MSKIDVIKENLQFQQLIRENVSNAILKDEYLIPDTHPDVQYILSIEAHPRIISKEIITDKVILEGKVEYTVLYIPREDSMLVNSVSYNEKFTSTLDLSEGEHKIICEVECKVEHIDARIMNERKIAIEGVIDLDWQLYKSTEFDFVKDIQASEGVEILKQTENLSRLAANKEVELEGSSMIRVAMDKPQISKILECSLNIHKKEVKMAEDKVYLSCYCRVNILYLGEESKEVVALEDDVYLSKEEEIAGVYSDMTNSVSYEIKSNDVRVEEDDLGEARIINSQFAIGALVKIFSDESIDIIKDAYAPKFPIELVKDDYEIGSILGSKSVENIIKDYVYIKENEVRADKIIMVTGNIVVTDKNVSDDKVTVEGIVKANIIYKTFEEDIAFGNVSGDIPFTTVIDMVGAKEGMKSILNCTLEGIEAHLEGNSIAVKAMVDISTKVFHEVKKEFISDVIEGEGEAAEKNSSIIIYVVGKGDTLWNLAKKYNTTVDELIKINSIDNPDVINEGDKLIVPGRAIF